MGKEIDLMVNYPKTKRDLDSRNNERKEDERIIARKFGKDFFDGDRKNGYGGYNYNARFWQPVIPTFQKHFGLTAKSSVLDVGCGKGFMMFDMSLALPGITVKGIDVSTYAVEQTIEQMKPHTQVADCRKLPFKDKSFDVVISINTVHNLEYDECGKSLQEIERVARGKSFITVDAYRDDVEKNRMFAWNLTAKTILHVDEWIKLFKEVGYTGDYYWFVP